MKRRVKKAWLTALRSGEYKQGRSALCRVGPDGEKSFCCLGVLCEIAARRGYAEVVLHQNRRSYGGHDTAPPFSVCKWAGIDTDPKVSYAGERTTLMGLNDMKRLSFEEIADIIEEQL